MNQYISDNKVSTVSRYLTENLLSVFDRRTAEQTTQWLFEAYCGWSRAELVLRQQEHLSESQLLQFHFALKRLKKHEPLQHVLGHAWFYGLKLKVNGDVLVPRPETEELVQWILSETDRTKGCTIVDIGTGSGCIALALKKHLPQARIIGIDVSEKALAIARENAQQHSLEVEWMVCDALHEIPALQSVDIIVSNPPYIPQTEAARMEANVLEYEPHLALFVPDDDALLFYRRILDIGKHIGTSSCAYYFEIHEDLKAQMQTLTNGEIRKDMQGKWRMMRVL